MRVLVIGGTGFIGTRLVNAFTRSGCVVYVLNRGSRLLENTIQLTADRNDYKQMSRMLIPDWFDVTVDLTCYTARQARIALAIFGLITRRWLYVSSAAVYDELANPNLESDNARGAPEWGVYGRGKADAEEVLRERRQFVILRPTYVYGPGNTADRETFVWSRLLRARPVLLPANGQAIVRFVHVDDLVRAIHTCSHAELDEKTVFNVANPQEIDLRELVATLAVTCSCANTTRPLGPVGSRVHSLRYFPFINHNLRPSVQAIFHGTDWRPTFDLQSGLQNTIDQLDRHYLASRPINTADEDILLSSLDC